MRGSVAHIGRKALALLAAAAFALALLAAPGCTGEGGQDGYVGHWVCCMVDTGNGDVVAIEDLENLGLTGEDFMTLDLAADGTATMTADGKDITADTELKWSENAMGIELDAGSGGTASLTYDSTLGQLLMEYQGQRIIFEKVVQE